MRRYCVCVPARDEETRVPTLLEALVQQTLPGAVIVSLCVNNSHDRTAAVARDVAARHRGRLDLRIDERTFADDLAHAGSARRAAMESGANALADPEAVLISTDADCRPPVDWIDAILAATDDDSIVGGRIRLDDAEAVPADILALRARFDRYWETVRAIEDEVDPSPWDLPPRHGDHTGASLALTVGLYRRAGGVPPIATGEDRALVAAAQAVGGRLIHPASVWTRTSARADGRAAGGMADDMARLHAGVAARAEPLVPDFAHWRRRAHWRRDMRSSTASALGLAEAALPPMPHDMPLPGLDA